VPRELAKYSLHVRPDAKPVKQLLWHFAKDRRKAIWEEIAMLLATGFTMEVLHPDWLCNPVMVENKKDEPAIVKVWCMCVDYTNLNKAYPKDPFLLPILVFTRYL
jgi:hypothetical protein